MATLRVIDGDGLAPQEHAAAVRAALDEVVDGIDRAIAALPPGEVAWRQRRLPRLRGVVREEQAKVR